MFLCLFGGAENGEEQVFTVVYGPGEDSAGSSFGDWLSDVRCKWGVPSVIGGDFNMVLCTHEQNMISTDIARMREFWQILDTICLIGLSLVGLGTGRGYQFHALIGS